MRKLSFKNFSFFSMACFFLVATAGFSLRPAFAETSPPHSLEDEKTSETDQQSSEKSVLLAILARNKAHVLPKFLQCIDALDYNKKSITVYINTNNNRDATEELLRSWVKKNAPLYKEIIFVAHEITGMAHHQPHEWSAERFKTLGKIRNESLRQALTHHCDYYFVVDCDNFIMPRTLKVLMSKDKPIIAPLLHPIPETNDSYSNYFCAVNDSGYYASHPDYVPIFTRTKRGTFQVPVAHCTYLIKAEYLDKLTYMDETDDYEFVIFSRSARNNNVDQYICNEEIFGTLVHFYEDVSLEEETKRLSAIGI